MKRPSGGWGNAGQAKPASEYEVRYGHGLLQAESSGWPPYVAVTTPSAYRTAKPYLAREPAGVGQVGLLDYGQLQDSIMGCDPVTDPRFDALWEFLEAT